MNSKMALLAMAAILLIVVNVMDESSTISAIAAADPEEITASVESGEEILKEAVKAPELRRSAVSSAQASTTSLDDFYETDEADAPDLSPEPEITDMEDEDTFDTRSKSSRQELADTSVETINKLEIGPKIR